MKTIRILTNNEQIEDACALLYEVYIEKYQWDFCPDNPSKIKIEIRNNRKLLVDKYINRSVWFGVFENEKLVGCSRVQGKGDQNLLAIEEYESSEIVLPFFKGRRDSCVELAKFAFLPNHISAGVVKKLFLALFKYCEQIKCSVLCCTHDSFLKYFFGRIEFPLKMAQAFKYEPNDSLPVNFYMADHEKNEIANIINILEISETAPKTASIGILKALEIAAEHLPLPVYWQDREGVVLGINELGLKGMGTSREIIGKTPYDFYPRSTAEYILKHHNLVMNRGEISAQEERINDITTGKEKFFSSIKAPLYDDEGAIVGIVGTSVDITREKEFERLKIENEKLEIQNKFQNKLIQEQNTFKKILDQAVHDIRSPLASLMIVANYTKNIPQDFCAVISGASRRINDIANNLLQKYKSIDGLEKNDVFTESRGTFQVLLALYEIISEKKYEFHDQPVEFQITHSAAGYSVHIYAEEAFFKRMISNLINNAVEAFEKKPGVVSVSLDCSHDDVTITLKDNGKGIAPPVLDKIRNNIPVTEGKSCGHGIGFIQVGETLRRNKGTMEISSTVGAGTSITLTLPKRQSPKWVAEKITLNQEDIILILDDDASIHKAWDLRLKDKAPANLTHHFSDGAKLLGFVEKFTPEQKEKTFLLADYELLYQDLNGLEVIEKSQLKRTVLVTSHYANSEVLEHLKKTSAKLLPKLFIGEIPFAAEDPVSTPSCHAA